MRPNGRNCGASGNLNRSGQARQEVRFPLHNFPLDLPAQGSIGAVALEEARAAAGRYDIAAWVSARGGTSA